MRFCPSYISEGRRIKMKFIKWHFRLNRKRKHPAIIFAESDDGKFYYNVGVTHSEKRGHHKNVEIKNPQNWDEISYVRDDMSIDEKEFLKEVLKDYKLHPEDYKKIWIRILKKKIK